MARICYSLAATAALVAAVLLAPACGGPPTAADRAEPPRPEDMGDTLPGSYIVAFREQGAGASRLRYASYLDEYRDHFSRLSERYLSDPRIRDIDFLTAVDLADPDAEDTLGASPTLRLAWGQAQSQPVVASLARVDFAGDAEARDLLAEWERGGDIWFAEPNYVSRLSQEPTNLFRTLADDYSKLNYWWLNAINLAPAFEAIAARDLSEPGMPTDEQIAASRPLIAVLDSGVDFGHPALKDRIWVNTDVNAANCDNDVHGCNTTVARRGKLGNGEVWPYDTSGPGESCYGKDNNCSHGTHVAGIIAADHAWKDPETGRHTAGVCPVCQIMILKIVSKVGKESGILDSSIIAAFKYVALFKREGNSAVRVINASFGKFVRSRSVGLLIRLMKEKRGTVLVGAAGNEDTLTQEYPAAFKDAVAVAAVDSRLHKVSFSNFGRWVDVAAPGSAILSTIPGGGSDSKSGTSMAAPMVSGVAGLIVARYPGISFPELRQALIATADPTLYGKDFEDGFNYTYYYPKVPQDEVRQPLLGAGLVDANAAVNRVPATGLPLYTDLDRVKRGCGVIGKAGATPRGRVGLAIAALLLAPLTYAGGVAVAAIARRRRRRS